MNPPARPPSTAAPAPQPASPTPVLPTNPRNWKKIILISLLAVLAIALLAGVYFLGAGVQSKKDAAALKASAEAAAVPVATPSPIPSPSSAPKIAAGFTKAQQLMDQGGKTIIRSVLQISYSGVLKAQDPDRSWTVEKNGQTVTIKQEGSQPVQYLLFKSQNSTAQTASASELGVGDTVTITAFVDTNTGVASVVSISFFKKV